MTISDDSEATFGYLSTWDSPEHGCLGGYLVVSELGRPMEFHCTAPVRTNRAQQILFGPTLWPYVMGEHIGRALLREAKLRPCVFLIDHPATLCLRPQLWAPMVLLKPLGEGELKPMDPPANHREATKYNCEFAAGYEDDCGPVTDLLATLAQHVDLAEPFDRIREAIREAQRLGACDQQDAHDQAA